MAAALELGVDPQLETLEPQLVEAGDLGRGEGVEAEVGERGPAPEGECCFERFGLVAALFQQRLEAPDVDFVEVRAQQVAAVLSLDPPR